MSGRRSTTRRIPGVVSLGLTALVVAGCASTGVDTEEIAIPAGLSIQIEEEHGGFLINTDVPASVAVFEIVPGRGAALLYPDLEQTDGRLDAGPTRIAPLTGGMILRHRAQYANIQQSRSGIQNLNEPAMVVAIACECDLQLTRMSESDGPRAVLGPFASVNTRTAAQKLAEAILPYPEAEWYMDRYIRGSR